MDEALGAKHADLDDSSSCGGDHWMAGSKDPSPRGDWEESDLTDWPDPRTKACWATPGWPGSSCDSPDPRALTRLDWEGRLEGRHTRPDFSMKDWEHPLPKLSNPEPVIQTGEACDLIELQTDLSEVGPILNTRDGKPVETGTTRSVSLDCVWTVCLVWHSSDLGCVSPAELSFWDDTRIGVSKVGHRESLISYRPPCWCKRLQLCCPLLSGQSVPCNAVRNSWGPKNCLELQD